VADRCAPQAGWQVLLVVRKPVEWALGVCVCVSGHHTPSGPHPVHTPGAGTAVLGLLQQSHGLLQRYVTV
jgi:hypothetical protein